MTGQARFGEENEPQQLRIVKDERFVPRETFDYRSCDDGTSLLTHSETSGPGILTSVQELKMDSRGNFLQLVEFERLNGGETEHRVSSFEACPSA